VGLHVYVPLFQFDLWISSQVFGVLEQIQTPPHPLIFVFLYIYIYIVSGRVFGFESLG